MTRIAVLLALVMTQASAWAQSAPPTQPGGAAAPGLDRDRPEAGVPLAPQLPPPGGVEAPQLPVLTLEEALRLAVDHNLSLKASQARLEQSKLLARRVWANYLPSLTVGGSYTRNNVAATFSLPTKTVIRDLGPGNEAVNEPPPGQTVPGTATTLVQIPTEFVSATIQPLNQFGGQVQLNQAIIAPALWPAISNAYLAEDIAALSVANARRDILFGVAQLYYGAAGLKQSVAVQQRLLETAQAHERDARVRYEAGAVPKIQLVRAQIDTASAEQDLVRAENALVSAKIALATLLGRTGGDYDVVQPEARQLVDENADLEEMALGQRFDVQAAHKSVDLAERQRSGNTYRYFPSLGFSGTYRLANATGFTNSNSSWALTLALTWTIYDGGLREVDAKEFSAKVVEAKAQSDLSDLQARQEVKQALLDLMSARANRVKAEERVKLAQENSQLVDVNYASGVATQLDVSDAQSSLASAERGLVAESLNAELAALRLAKAAGAFEGPVPQGK